MAAFIARRRFVHPPQPVFPIALAIGLATASTISPGRFSIDGLLITSPVILVTVPHAQCTGDDFTSPVQPHVSQTNSVGLISGIAYSFLQIRSAAENVISTFVPVVVTGVVSR
jgi:hypothetical protein